MRGTRIQPDTLEDNLICDDLFYEYFSTFLSLPCFPSRVYYNRLTGGIELIEAEDNYADENPVVSVQWAYDRDRAEIARRSHAVGYTEDRRQRMLMWAADDRLPLFVKSPLYREFKLCRHLLKPVDLSKPRSGRVRGYSIDTDAISSLTTAAKSQSAGADAEDSSDDRGGAADDWFRQLASAYRHMRPSSQAISLPPKLEYPGVARYFESDGNGNGTSKDTPGGSYKSIQAGSSHRYSHDLMSHPSDAAGGKGRSVASSSSEPTTDSTSNHKRPVSKGNGKSARPLDDSTSQGSYYNRVVSAPSKVGKSSASISEVSNENDQEDLDEEEEDEGEESDDEEDEEDARTRSSQSSHKTYLVENSQGEHRRTNKEAKTAVSILERKHGRSVQEIKDQLIGNLSGMQSFRAFLEGTLGSKLYDFWLEAERYKDEYEPVADQEDKRRQHQLYRNILDLYGTLLTEEVRNELHQIFSDSEMDRTTWTRPQYGALRRLRAYWLPRYILHRERLGLLSTELGSQTSRVQTALRRPASTYSPLSFPTLSLGSWVCSLHSVGLWTLQNGTSRPQSRATMMSSMVDLRSSMSESYAGGSVASGTEPCLRDKLISALMYETLGGGPLTRFARRDRRRVLLNMLNFHRDVAELSALVTCLRNDRLLRRERYWSIYNKYIDPESKSGIECPSMVVSKVHAALSLGDSNSFILKPAVFGEGQMLTIDKIMPHWVDFLKADALTALTAVCLIDLKRDPSNGPGDRRIKNEDVEFISDNSTLIVKLKKWIRRCVGETPPGAITPSSASQRKRREFLEDSLWDAASQARWRKWLSDQRKSAERLRKEALRAAHLRLVDQKRAVENANRLKRAAKPKPQAKHERDDADMQQLDKIVDNKILLSLFRKSLESVPDIAELLGVYQAILQYSHEEPGPKRDSAAVAVYKQFLDPQSPNHVPIDTIVEAPELRHSLTTGQSMEDGIRPASPALNDFRRMLAGKFTIDLSSFLKKQSEQLGLSEPAALIAMTPDALKSRIRQVKAEQATQKQREGRLRRGEGGAGGRAPASREDRSEFMQLLTSAAYGPFPRRLVAFRRYLSYFSDVDKVPQLENDLLFCIEAHRFKAACHPDQDEQWLKRKLIALIDTYMDAAIQPSCQLDLSNDVNERFVKSLRRSALTLEFSPNLFEELLNILLNAHIYQYYAGFRRVLNENPDTEENVMVQPTKKEKTLIQRHRQFEDFHPPSIRKVSKLPPVPERGPVNPLIPAVVYSLHFTLSEGASWKETESKLLGHRNMSTILHNKLHAAMMMMSAEPAQDGD